MEKRGVRIDIPGFGSRIIQTIVTDYTGTLSYHGRLTTGVASRLRRLRKFVHLEIVTADTYGTARQQLRGIATPHMLKKGRQDIEKRDFAKRFSLKNVAAFGNGNNDRLLLRLVRKSGGLAIAVDNGEGCALDAVLNANISIFGAADALDLVLKPNALKATLRF